MCKDSQIADANAARYVEVVRARAPRGFSDAIRQAAETRQMSQSEFIRAALSEKLRDVTPIPRGKSINEAY
jgi:hypothetical protein